MPREPGLRQLRPVDGQLSDHLDGAGDQLRDVPQSRGGACAGGPETPKGEPLKDVKLIVTKKFTVEQHNSNCGPCHAKMSPSPPPSPPGSGTSTITTSRPWRTRTSPRMGGTWGELHLHALEDEPCVKSGKLGCMHCHTSSGRYRFKKPRTRTRRVSRATRSGWGTPLPTAVTRREARRAVASRATCP